MFFPSNVKMKVILQRIGCKNFQKRQHSDETFPCNLRKIWVMNNWNTENSQGNYLKIRVSV